MVTAEHQELAGILTGQDVVGRTIALVDVEKTTVADIMTLYWQTQDHYRYEYDMVRHERQ